jgi:ABC-type multidrug transport system ATPase subunit
MRLLSDQGMTIILTSHNFETVNTFCARALLFHGGCLVADGKPQEILPLYRGREKSPVSIPSGAGAADSSVTIAI